MLNSQSNQKQFSAIALRTGLALLLSLTITACGFQLRGAATLSFKSLYIQGASLSISRELIQSLKSNGIVIECCFRQKKHHMTDQTFQQRQHVVFRSLYYSIKTIRHIGHIKLPEDESAEEIPFLDRPSSHCAGEAGNVYGAGEADK